MRSSAASSIGSIVIAGEDRLQIPDYFACGADEGYSALGPASEPAPAQGGSALDSECARTPVNISAAPME